MSDQREYWWRLEIPLKPGDQPAVAWIPREITKDGWNQMMLVLNAMTPAFAVPRGDQSAESLADPAAEAKTIDGQDGKPDSLRDVAPERYFDGDEVGKSGVKIAFVPDAATEEAGNG
jgi:hypothetical protein